MNFANPLYTTPISTVNNIPGSPIQGNFVNPNFTSYPMVQQTPWGTTTQFVPAQFLTNQPQYVPNPFVPTSASFIPSQTVAPQNPFVGGYVPASCFNTQQSFVPQSFNSTMSNSIMPQYSSTPYNTMSSQFISGQSPYASGQNWNTTPNTTPCSS